MTPRRISDCGWFVKAEPIRDAKTCREACKVLNIPQKRILGGNWVCYKDSKGNCYQNGKYGGGGSLVCKNLTPKPQNLKRLVGKYLKIYYAQHSYKSYTPPKRPCF